MKYKTTIPLLAALAFASCVPESDFNNMNTELTTRIEALEKQLAEQKATAPCFVNIEVVFEAYPEKQSAQGQLNALIAQVNGELGPLREQVATKEKEILALRAELDGYVKDAKETKKQEVNPKAVEAKDALLELAKELEPLKKELAQKTAVYQNKVDLTTEKTKQQLYKNCATVATVVAKELGYDYVINSSITGNGGIPVIIGRTTMENDISQAVISRLVQLQSQSCVFGYNGTQCVLRTAAALLGHRRVSV